MTSNRVFFLLILLLLTACADVPQPGRETIRDFALLYQIEFPFTIDKCLYSSFYETLYISEKHTTLVHFYKNGLKLNTIGGSGPGNSSFLQLSDIALTPDGKLLVLDSTGKIIRKYDQDGKWIADLALPEKAKPLLMDVGKDGSIYYFDAERGEIVQIDPFTHQEKTSFGKFHLFDPSGLIIIDNLVQVYEALNDVTVMFSIMGKHLGSYPGYYQQTEYEQIKLQDYYLLETGTGKRFFPTTEKWKGFYLKNSYLILYGEHSLVLALAVYENK